MRIDSHAVGERFRLLTHEMYSDVIAGDPSLVARAKLVVAERLGSSDVTFSDRMWAVLLEQSVDDVRFAMTLDGPEGDLLRSGSPFSLLIGVADRNERTRLWQRATTQLEASRM